MNKALVYLWWALLVRKSLRHLSSFRRPLSLVGWLAVVSLLSCIFYFRHHDIVGRLVRRENLVGCALVMICGSIFKGFLQRGLLCEPADVEFLFTSPFSQRQVVFYRLLPNYLYALVQSLVFLALFGSHFQRPFLAAGCLALFQIVCFHLATAAALFGGSISDPVHYRLRWMLLGSFGFIAAFYLRWEWDLRIVPAFASAPAFALLFYPAVTLPDAVSPIPAPWVQAVWSGAPGLGKELGRSALYLGGFAAAALASLWLLFRFRTNIFETALETTTRAADQRRRLRDGLRGNRLAGPTLGSMRLPQAAFFRGVGAIVWKNLVAARRSRREMLLAGCFVLVYTGFFTALLWIYHGLGRHAGGVPLYEARGFTTGIALFLGMLGFLLQRMFPFDFRRDGPHLLSFRTLPNSALAVALAELAVPTALCLAAQACGVVPLIVLGKFDWPTSLLVVLGYPAVALALNSVWNLHYLLAAGRRAQGRGESATAVGMVLVVAMSFLVFYPAGWTTVTVANHLPTRFNNLGPTLAAGSGLLVQLAVDVLLVLCLARLFERYEISRDS